MSRERFKEFRQIIQGKKIEKRKINKNWWYSHSIFTFFSRYITWILVKTPITANFITITGLLIGLTGLLFIALGNNLFIIIGFILLYICYISDEVDGEVARYKKQTSLRGIYYDQVAHFFLYGWFFISITYSIYRINSEFLYIMFGVITTFLFLGFRIVGKFSIYAFVKGEIKKWAKGDDDNDKSSPQPKTFVQKFRSVLKNLMIAFSTAHLTTTVFFVGFLLFFNFNNSMILEIITIAYVVFLLLVFTTFMVLKGKNIEKDVQKLGDKNTLKSE